MDSDQRQGIGQVVRTLREASGLTRAELAEATSRSPKGRPVSAEMIAKIEQGRKGPSVASLNSLAHALGVDVADLSERGSAWQAAAAAGVSPSALRAGTIAGALTGAAAITAGLASGIGAPLAVGAAAGALTRSHQERRRLEQALRERLSTLSDDDLARVAVALGVEQQSD